jgi:hypothetical protein
MEAIVDRDFHFYAKSNARRDQRSMTVDGNRLSLARQRLTETLN